MLIVAACTGSETTNREATDKRTDPTTGTTAIRRILLFLFLALLRFPPLNVKERRNSSGIAGLTGLQSLLRCQHCEAGRGGQDRRPHGCGRRAIRDDFTACPAPP